jgi:putative phosphoesterase
MPMIRSRSIRATKQSRLAEPESTGAQRIGVVSDTHGLMRPEALEVLQGSELIIHAGDIGGPKVLDAFRAVAPVVAVRGNNDRGEWARKLPKMEIVEIDGARILVVHILRVLDLDLTGIDCVISGHTHRASARKKDGVLYLNPGSAGPRRFGQPATVAMLQVRERALDAEIIHLLK